MRRLLLLFCTLLSALALGQLQMDAGPYRLELQTKPQVIPVGAAHLVLKVTDKAGTPIPGLTVTGISQMPGMFMGERKQPGRELREQPGTYEIPTSFPMAGSYETIVDVSGKQGAASATFQLRTGTDAGSASSGFSALDLLPWLVAVAAIVFVIVRMRRTGQSADVRSLASRGTIGGLALLAVLLLGARYAVNNWRRPGAMTPLEAQVMEMNTPAPAGVSAVELGEVTEGSLSETVRYAGQAVGNVEQPIYPRVTGTILSMPVYVGDRVRKGQILAQLDTSQLDPNLAEKAAMSGMAAKDLDIAASEHESALQDVAEAQATLSGKRSAVDEAKALASASAAELRAAGSEVTVAESEIKIADAEAVSAGQAAAYSRNQLERNRALFADGFISRAALQLSETEAAESASRLSKANADVSRSKARLDAARADLDRAKAMALANERRVRQAEAEVREAQATVAARRAGADAARKRIARERASVDQARAGYQGAAAERAYATIRAEVDGVVTERLISPGVLVAPGQAILKVAQVAPIRLQANIATADAARVRVGSRVKITGQGISEFEARLTSVSPGLDPASRTAVAEVLWPNADGAIKPGQFLAMDVEVGESSAGITVPSSAVQRPAGTGSPFVWVADGTNDRAVYTVRRVEVRLGVADQERIQVLDGLKPGQRVVTKGAMFLKDGERVSAQEATPVDEGTLIRVSAAGFDPNRVEVERGKPVTLIFQRVSEEGCGTEVVFPDLKIGKDLPLNARVKVTFTPTQAGELSFACGMDMLRGKVIVR